ncbi:MAG TPA: hypothetical protein VFM15_03585 [Gammaproteobacteria bacterium]|nr:hypothetical protein [Gammaproteobacteria bacterium]
MRIFMGIVWFVVFFIVLYIAFSIVLGVMISGSTHASTVQEGMQAGMAFAREHALALSLCRWGIFIVSVAGAVLGTWKRVLPGTRKPKTADPTPTA